MAYDFNADEIFELAQQIEKNGVAFYTRAAESVDDEESKKLLLKLADMEVEHEKTFGALRSELTGGDKAKTVFDPNDETALYLKALADTRVFFEKEIDLSSMVTILKAAIAAEKDSIVLYLGMKDLVSEQTGKKRLNAIIKEEMGHITLLSRELVARKK